jgi:alpha-L-fucosidase 2
MKKLHVIVTLSGLLGAFTLSAAESPLKLEYDRPSRNWDEYLPVGNGFMGAMVSGRPDMEHLQLNVDSLWSGAPAPVDLTRTRGSGETFATGQQLFQDGNFDEAMKVMAKAVGVRSPSHYEALGDLKLAFTHSLRGAKNYRRELDLNDAMVRISYEDQGVTFTREVFASYPDRAIVVRLAANKEGQLTFEAKLDRDRGASARSIAPDMLVMRGQTGPDGLTFESRVSIVNTGGSVTTDANLIRVCGADEVLIFIVAGTNYKNPYQLGEDPAVACEKRLASVSAKGWDELKMRHLKDYQALFGRVTLDLGRNEMAAKPIGERLRAMSKWIEKYQETGYQEDAISPDPQLISLLFQFGRYILISSSREGTLPANLQGMWSDDITNPAWKCDFHTDINFQENYWPSDVANLSECAEPLYSFLESFVPAGEKIARDVYGARGWVLGLHTDTFSGGVIGGNGLAAWTFGSGWLCRHLMEHYHYSGDVEFLRNRAYPLMKGAAQFYLDTLVEAPEGSSVAGKLVMFPSLSPENFFTDKEGKRGMLAYGSAMDTQIMVELFNNCLESQSVLKLDSAEEQSFKRELEAALSKLPPYQISATDGRLLEWPEEFKERHRQHRHLSHLYALYPSDTINASTPKLLEAARKSLEVRTEGVGGTGWSKSWAAALWARLGDGDRATFFYNLMLGQLVNVNMFNLCFSGTGAHGYPNYWWDGLYLMMQVDGNLAVSGGLPELLVQSHLRNPDGTFMIDLLPALPTSWRTGSVSGLRVRGGFEVDIEWEDGKLKQAAVTSVSGKTGTLRYGDKVVTLEMKPAQQFNFNASLEAQ